MMNKSIIVIFVILAVVALGIAAIYFYNQEMPSQNYPNTTDTKDYNLQTQGKVIFGIKDAAQSMGGVTSIMITVNKIEMHSKTQGWITISNAPKQYDLLALKQSGTISLLAQTNVEAGTYDQMRLMVDKVVVVKNGVQQEAKLPSGELKIVGTVVVNENKTSTAVFDFIADKSLHVTGNGKFIFTPVLKIETKSDADVQIKSNDEVHINGGWVESEISGGMDVNGEMKANFELDENTNLDLVNNILKVTAQGENDKLIKVTSDTAINTALNGYLNTVISVKLMTENGKKVWMVSGLKNLALTNVSVDAVTGAVVSSNAQVNN